MSDLYDHALERNVLGIMSNISALDVAKARSEVESTRLTKECFHAEPHAAIFQAAITALKKGFPVDPFTVQTELKRAESLVAMDMDFVSQVLLGVHHIPDSSLSAYAKTLTELSIRRNVFTLFENARARISDRSVDPGEIISDISSKLLQVDLGSQILTMSDLMVGMAQHLDNVQEGKNEPIIQTGIGPLDHVIGGLPATLVLVGALPGVGKSALVSAIARNLARRNVVTGVLSLEDEATWLPWRLLAREASVEQFILRFRRLNEFQGICAKEGYEEMDKYSDNILLADFSDRAARIDEVIQTANDMVVKHGARCIVVDHIGEIAQSGSGERYDLEVSSHLSRLRSVANRHGVPVIAVMHLRRREGLGVGSKPTLTDFANSSGAERKARIALALSRAEGGETMQIHILKNTLGKGTGSSVEIKFHGPSATLDSNAETPVQARPEPKPVISEPVQDKMPWDQD